MTTVIEAIRGRTSANNYDATHVMSREEITELVALAPESPSSFNMQNWRFIAVSSPEAKARLKAAAFNQPKVGDAAVTYVVVGEVGGHRHLPRLIKPMLDAGAINQAAYEGWINMANGLYEGKDQFQRDEAIRSASLASMTLMLAATGKGYVSGAMIGFDPAAVAAACGLAAHEVPVMLIAVGKPAPGNWPRKVRRSLDEVLSFR
ncbi:MAG: nitroreductase family protein [Burkholderiaceae bacterium]